MPSTMAQARRVSPDPESFCDRGAGALCRSQWLELPRSQMPPACGGECNRGGNVQHDCRTYGRWPGRRAVGDRLDQCAGKTTEAKTHADGPASGARLPSARRRGGNQRAHRHRPRRGDPRAPPDPHTSGHRKWDRYPQGLAGYAVPYRGDAAKCARACKQRRRREQPTIAGHLCSEQQQTQPVQKTVHRLAFFLSVVCWST